MPVAINGSAGSSDYPFDLARAFGVRRRNTVRVDEGNVFFESIILATQSYILQKRISTRFWTVAGRIRDRYAPDAADRAASERLYVSRRGAGKRRLLEEAAVEDLFRERGFAVLHPERASIAEQVRAFAAAAWVAGPVGSGLYNSIFSPADVRRIILAPAWFYTPNDVLMSRVHGPRYLFGGGPEHPKRAMVEDWSIDVDGVRRALDGILETEDRNVA